MNHNIVSSANDYGKEMNSRLGTNSSSEEANLLSSFTLFVYSFQQWIRQYKTVNRKCKARGADLQ